MKRAFYHGDEFMYTKEFNIPGHLAKTLEPEYIGEHDGWIITGEICKDYYE